MFEGEDADRKKSINHCKFEIEKLETQKVVLQDNFLNQKLSIDEYREMKQVIDGSLHEEKSKLDELETQTAPIKDY